VKLVHAAEPLTVIVLAFEVPLPEIKTLSADVGADAPTVAAVIDCEEIVPEPEVVHVFPLPPVIVPALVKVPVNWSVLYQTVIPTTSAGEPVVVNVFPDREAVNTIGEAADQLVVALVFQVPDPPTQ
jgi:hypothetical protein